MINLDDLGAVKKLDAHDCLGILGRQAEQLRYDFGRMTVTGGDFTAVVVAGMGGSALAAEFARDWLSERLPVPVEIVRGYELPAYAGTRTLAVVSSYSGNTEEALACLEEAERRGLGVVVMASGGELSRRAEASGYTRYVIPAGLEPRQALFYEVRAMADLLEAAGLAEGLGAELEQAAGWLERELARWGAGERVEGNAAKQVAIQLAGNPVVVYGGPGLRAAAMKWKIGFNENAKQMAFWNALPEMDHNEFMGWRFPAEKDFSVVELRSGLDGGRVAKRFEATNRLLKGQMPEPVQVEVKGGTRLEQMLWTISLGDFVSTYAAFLNGVDPFPVALVEELKAELKAD